MAQRSFFCVLSADISASAAWYRDMFGYRTEFDSDWFVHLTDPENAALELGILDVTHDIVPDAQRRQPTGGMLTIVVDDVDTLYERAVASGADIVEPPRDLFYGQRRLLVRDPDGQLVDVSSECDPDPAWIATLGQ